MRVGRLRIEASRWPWQKQVGAAPLNPGMARFGGGWQWCLGIRIGGSGRTVLLELGWGMIRFSFPDEKRHRELLEKGK